ncbi:bifunctional adenosylcobinamide kinase/adenosylcobinamide-phosphate guanylyltransferase [Deferribacter autotrophicus]|uniref:Adenosylcobinamide kinase n=1 Tax=Deferribacter autotrophicus TaxID=500465 RepID=A0A5A8F5B2_9BACT|nr:bifunctional adenosylcobinamide kinase/adenosylcobinamide-phosphate guanylyltransferase [Deferribacter autotrophicus]KAA0257842.1 bifunctional adenosylcobinamide kinase/adenosylcobinamide-phosphate guanylyltransferase [Deferribacter autotrophicus]
MVTLITGGIKSGKTSYAIKLALTYEKRIYLATAEPFDEEMKKKIERHRAERENRFDTIEEPVEIVKVLGSIKDCDVVVLDCLTTWVNNLMYYKRDVDNYFKELTNLLPEISYNLIIITNEVGLGIVPAGQETRRYVNFLGIINQKVAAVANNCILMVSGIPVKIKEEI